MADIASLGIVVRTDGAKEAATDLNKLDAASQKVEKSTQTASKAMSASAKSAQELANAAKQAAPAQTALANAHELTTARFLREQGVRERLTKLIQTDRGARILEANAANGQAAGFAKVGAAMGATALSAKQLQFATRGVPAQFTDIAVALQSGQRPLQVLLQQGGQLKDMFGGIGPAARALGGYIAGLVNPFTIAAAAAVTLGLAWKQGSDEAVGFNQALALTGNIAGTTTEQMQGMALAISQTAGTQHEAAKALAEVAKTGRFTADQLQAVATAAIAMEHATGQAVEETVKQFTKLADDPVKAVVELNDKYHLLTLEQYEHIKALQAQGREEEAVTQAIRDASAGLTKRAKDVVDNAGYMERAWRGLGAVVRQVWDDMRDAGRTSTAITQSQMAIASANSQLNSIANRTRLALANGRKYTQAEIQALKADTSRLVEIKRKAAASIANDPGTAAAARTAATQRANEIAIALDQEAATFESQVVKLGKKKTAALGKADEAIRLAQKQGNSALVESIKADAKAIGDAIDKEIKEIEEREKKKGRKPKKESTVDQGQSILARVRQQIALNSEELASTEALTTSERLRISVIEQLKDARLKTNSATRAAIDVALKELEASDKTLQSHKEEEKALESLRRLTNELSTAEQNRRRQNEAQLLGIGRGRLEQEQALRRLDIERDYFDEVKRLNDLAAQEKRKVSQAELDALKEFHDRALVEEEDFQKRRSAMAADWRNGARAATADFIEAARDVASQTYDIARNFYDGVGDVITDALTRGKADWRDFLNDIGRQITAMTVKVQLAKLAEKFMPGAAQGDQASALSESANKLAASAAPLMAAAAALTSAAGALAAAGVAGGGSSDTSSTGGSSGGFNWGGLLSSFMGLFGGGRANGGPVSRGKLYEVGEGGRPEILTMHGRNWLIPGAGGQVTPMAAANDDGGARIVNQAFYVQGAPNAHTREQMARSSGREAARGIARTGR